MRWTKLFINDRDPVSAAQSVAHMRECIHLARFLREATSAFEVSHLRASSRENIYCLSANAATCVLPMLEPALKRNIAHYDEKPDLAGYTKVG